MFPYSAIFEHFRISSLYEKIRGIGASQKRGIGESQKREIGESQSAEKRNIN